MTPEGLIKRAILDWLEAKKIFHWVNQAGKIPGRRLLKTGISDILGIYEGKFLAIEVKSDKGQCTPEQKAFIFQVRLNGGIAFVARSVEDVERILNNYNLDQEVT